MTAVLLEDVKVRSKEHNGHACTKYKKRYNVASWNIW